jgi:hypothetical protein
MVRVKYDEAHGNDHGSDHAEIVMIMQRAYLSVCGKSEMDGRRGIWSSCIDLRQRARGSHCKRCLVA